MSTVDFRQIPDERLSTTDELGNRIHVIPAKVSGVWSQRKNILHAFLIILLLALPWISVNGKPAILLNLPDREFTFFGTTLYAHDGPLVFFILATAAMTLAFVTVVWGRVWCGWACPQTVFIEGIFRRIERMLLGDRMQQIAFYNAPLTFGKIIKTLTKWALFVLAAVVLSHTLVAYFVGKNNLFHMMGQPPAESWTVFVIMLFITGVVLFDFTWFREQFCIIMCPYGRLQGLLLDQNSITIAYDEKRGEPRGKPNVKGVGDCVDCYRCVAVCPTGIDIRKGQQLECIGCTACIDACNDVMAKLKRPPELIGYRSLKNLEGFKTRFVRPRPIVFGSIVFILTISFIFAVSSRKEINIDIIRGIDTPYEHIQENGTDFIANHYKLHIKNQSNGPIAITVQLSPEETAKGFTLSPQPLTLNLQSKQNLDFPIFIKMSSATTKDFPLTSNVMAVFDYGNDRKVVRPLVFVHP